MSNVVNLGRARKRKREAAEKQRADENAIRHGRPRDEKAREHMDQARHRAIVDGARLEPAGGRGDADAADPPPHASDDEPRRSGDEPEA